MLEVRDRKLSEITGVFLDSYIKLQQEDGAFPAGHNGPYFDPETAVRNTSHALFMLSEYYRHSPKPSYKEAAEKAINYLYSDAARPSGMTFHCRTKPGKDSCNGLVGQAWVIEALTHASQTFSRIDCYEFAEAIYLMHPWCESTGLWHRVDIDGKVLSFDPTFNHQLWFAAAASTLRDTPAALNSVQVFLDKVDGYIQLYPNGTLVHNSNMGSLFNYLGISIFSFFREFKTRISNIAKSKSLYSKSVGYHAFNLYAFAMLKQQFPNCKLFDGGTFSRMLRVINDKKFQQDLLNSEFGYFYNLSGFELAFTELVFKEDEASAAYWISKQFEHTYRSATEIVSSNAPDPNTACARVYELMRVFSMIDIRLP